MNSVGFSCICALDVNQSTPKYTNEIMCAFQISNVMLS